MLPTHLPLALHLLLAPARPSAAGEQPLQDALELSAGASRCLQRDRLAQQLQVWTATPTLNARLRIRVIEDPEQVRRATFELWDGEARLEVRTIEALPEDCEAAHAALGLAIAFTLDATLLREFGAEGESSAASDATGASAQLEGQPRVRATTRTPDDRVELPRAPLGLEAKVSAAYGVASAFALGGQASLRVELSSHASLRVSGGILQGLPQALGAGQVRTRLPFARIEGCGGGRLSAVDLRACAGMLGGGARVQGEGYSRDRVTHTAWLGGTLGVALRVPAGRRVSLSVDADLVVPLVATRVDIIDPDTGAPSASVDPAPAGVLTGLGISVQLP